MRSNLRTVAMSLVILTAVPWHAGAQAGNEQRGGRSSGGQMSMGFRRSRGVLIE